MSWNVVEFPAMAHIYIDYDDTPTGEAECCWCVHPDLAQCLYQSK